MDKLTNLLYRSDKDGAAAPPRDCKEARDHGTSRDVLEALAKSFLQQVLERDGSSSRDVQDRLRHVSGDDVRRLLGSVLTGILGERERRHTRQQRRRRAAVAGEEKMYHDDRYKERGSRRRREASPERGIRSWHAESRATPPRSMPTPPTISRRESRREEAQDYYLDDERERRRRRRSSRQQQQRQQEELDLVALREELEDMASTLTYLNARNPEHRDCDFYDRFVDEAGRLQLAIGSTLGRIREAGEEERRHRRHQD